MLIADLALVFVVGFLVYASLIGAFGFFNSGKRIREHHPESRFAVLIPAHNEEMVIEPLLESLENQDYPRTLYDVYVIADNCTDDTARRARAAG